MFHADLLYVRNYGDIDLPWQEVFQTQSRSDVEHFCRQNNINFNWLGDGKLQTSQIRPAVKNHPSKNIPLWFNQAHLFHPSSLSEESRESFIKLFGENGLPRNVYFSDGQKIPDEYISEIKKAMKSCMVCFDWQQGDLMLLDNMLYAHGRNSFSGERKVLTGMAGRVEDDLVKW